MHLKKCVLHLISLIILLPSILVSSSPFVDQDCLTCHGKPEIAQITPAGAVRSLYVDPKAWEEDVHHRGQITCVGCHVQASPFLHFREGYADVICARCHPEEEEEYQKNIHFAYTPVTPGKELPQCYHCHTKHQVLRHDHPDSSVHEKNISRTCGICHAEVMVKGLLQGTSLGKISGHRKGDISERFDMNVCISCHYADGAHGAKRVFKDFCVRCHEVRVKPNPLIGPTHLDSAKWTVINQVSSGMVVFFAVGLLFWLVYSLRRKLKASVLSWYERMKFVGDSAPQAPEEQIHEEQRS